MLLLFYDEDILGFQAFNDLLCSLLRWEGIREELGFVFHKKAFGRLEVLLFVKEGLFWYITAVGFGIDVFVCWMLGSPKVI